MISARWSAAIAAVLLVTLAPLGVALHEHDADSKVAGNADCAACHFRHLSVTTTDGAPAPTAPVLVAHAVDSAPEDDEFHVTLGIRPTRGPPA